ncbi:polysaccharide pyruvyl transferase family protein [Clostridium perfringens]|uniref:polysaccharide pyruvyl transferase family protein n=1 Tax=Clostridium perfringens TaxID=1502 RepID=UPI0018E47155|nr:polysaccharide pyruvyl transferase family protein [Clostridium perfringens]MBI6060432.1 polysaccharide pyruvyl transferase family protein [Clostridium perfringens]
MDKVAIITLNGYFNYGNRLQNYALQESIKMLGFECETLKNETLIRKDIKCENNKFKEWIINKTLEEKITSIYSKLKKRKIKEIKEYREKIFKEFSEKYINEFEESISVNNISNNIIERYKYFVSGSDQVWNPNDPSVSELNFLTFANYHKRITYAPSFGVSEIPKEYKDNYKLWLDGIKELSVRENEGANIIKELTGKDAMVVIDPTMLITKEQWLKIAKKSSFKSKKKYILTYFLGSISKEIKEKINKISKLYNLEIVNLNTIDKMSYYVTGPSEFIDYINSAELFVTDSFHGCVFSLLLETNFIVCNRSSSDEKKAMGSRIETFLNKFDLHDRKFENIDNDKLFNYDYKKANYILEVERKKSWEYLKSALK